ncbi:putative peptide/nitrate transporter [Platanthera zijinensis]|uniref:Peptide/nitrate transporter n=1 Tax=Platanthera zijinensis TaxID=2320716 RepID=A0AAP0C0V5_9ASPA
MWGGQRASFPGWPCPRYGVLGRDRAGGDDNTYFRGGDGTRHSGGDGSIRCGLDNALFQPHTKACSSSAMADAENGGGREDEDYTEDGTMDIKGRPCLRSKGGRWFACYFIVERQERRSATTSRWSAPAKVAGHTQRPAGEEVRPASHTQEAHGPGPGGSHRARPWPRPPSTAVVVGSCRKARPAGAGGADRGHPDGGRGWLAVPDPPTEVVGGMAPAGTGRPTRSPRLTVVARDHEVRPLRWSEAGPT